MKKFLKLLTGKGSGDKSFAQGFYDDLVVDVLARTLWGEARGEGPQGMEAVASVILNRVKVAESKGKYWWGNDIISVCQKPYQFSCWNRSDANYRQLQAVTEKDIHYATALRVARRAVVGTLPDTTGGATHYHAKSILPDWAAGQKPTVTIRNHIFYKLIEV
jgi:spore germination cell wall hydrolase CwlJ-like protein